MPAGARVQQPLAALLIPMGSGHLDACANPIQDPVAPGDVLEVGLDLGLRGVAARPTWVWREPELVEGRRDIAGGAGIGVGGPDPPDLRPPPKCASAGV